MRRTLKAAHPRADHEYGRETERKKEYGLKGVHPRRAAHTPKEHVAHYHERYKCTTKPIRNDASTDYIESSSATHDADDYVGHEQYRLDDEDSGSDVAALPSIAKHLHRRHETVFLPKRPHASTDEENGQRNHEARG